MSIDRAKLEEACQYAHQEIFGERRHPGKVACMDANLLNVLKMAAEAHLATLPKTKMVEVWHVAWVDRTPGGDHIHCKIYRTPEEADRHADYLRLSGAGEGRWSCIRVTGPHQQEVPA